MTSHKSRGSVFVSLMIFTVVGLIITGVAVSLTLDAIIKSSKLKASAAAYMIAESGAENAILRMLRDPSYTGEVLSIDDGIATISVAGATPVVIRSEGEFNSFKRIVEVAIERQNGVLTVSSWREVQ